MKIMSSILLYALYTQLRDQIIDVLKAWNNNSKQPIRHISFTNAYLNHLMLCCRSSDFTGKFMLIILIGWLELFL